MALSLGFGILFATVNTLNPRSLPLFDCRRKQDIYKASGRQPVHHHACNRTADRKRRRNFRRHPMNLHSCFPTWKQVKNVFFIENE
jgi:hypothetical protein